MLLPELVAAALPNAEMSYPTAQPVTGIEYDSRRVQPGSIFVAVPKVESGSRDSGGFAHIAEAVRRGAQAVVSEAVPAASSVPVIQVGDARAALADLASVFYDHPSEKLKLYGVTGTDGKTTTTYLLEQILSHAGYRTGLIGTVEVKIGAEREWNVERMTTPESSDLQRLLKRMVDAKVTHVAMEVSSHALALERARGCAFAACGLTNITADHIEFHGSPERYFNAKASLFTALGRRKPAILNRDDSSFARLVELVEGPISTYGFGKEADVGACNISSTSAGTDFSLQARGEKAQVRLALPGRFNVANALGAAALALTTDQSLEVVAEGLSSAAAPPGRLQRITCGQPFEVVVDYAHTVNAFSSVLAALRDSAGPGRLIAVFGATGDRDRAKRPKLAQLAHAHTDFFIITNEDPYGEDAEAIISEVAAGVPLSDEGTRFAREPDREEAINRAIRMARPEDTVVVLGKGHERSMVVGRVKEAWDDVAIVRRALGCSS